MRIVKEAATVAIQDIAIVGVFVGLSCLVTKGMETIGQELSMAFLVLLILVLFILLFYSNGGLFKHFNNDYVWSMGSGVVTILMVIPSVMWVLHRAC